MNAWVFDIDGVITNLLNQRIEKPEIFDELSKRLDKNEPVGLITGRSFKWIEDHAWEFMPKNKLDNIFISAEFSGVIVTFDKNSLNKKINEDAIIPNDIKDQAFEIASQFKEHMRYEPKETVLSFRVLPTIDYKEFKVKQKLFVEELKEMVKEKGLDTDYQVHLDRLGTNVRRTGIDKHSAVREFLRWLNSKNMNPDYFYVFGDSDSDLEMGEELQKQNKNFTFVYVGEDLNTEEIGFPITQTNKHYDEGTLEYLQNH